MKILYLLALCLIPLSCRSDANIEETEYEGRPHYLVRTAELDYYYDIQGGGFSRIIDKEGNDWISFRMEPWGSYPASAASSFRGLPNLVFQQADDGAGHPGHDKCNSRVTSRRIITESASGLWKWSWEFHDSYAILDIIHTDPERSYWFLYEGTPGGSYNPDHSYFGSNKGGPFRARYDYHKGDIYWDRFHWIYAGSSKAAATFFMIQEQEDEHMDMVSYLGNTGAGMDSPDGMTVIGFGRDKEATPLLKGSQRFIIGLYPEKIQDKAGHRELRNYIETRLIN
jgi:hypothetical protein